MMMENGCPYRFVQVLMTGDALILSPSLASERRKRWLCIALGYCPGRKVITASRRITPSPHKLWERDTFNKVRV
jgi:hypothetical protein